MDELLIGTVSNDMRFVGEWVVADHNGVYVTPEYAAYVEHCTQERSDEVAEDKDPWCDDCRGWQCVCKQRNAAAQEHTFDEHCGCDLCYEEAQWRRIEEQVHRKPNLSPEMNAALDELDAARRELRDSVTR